MSKPPPVVKKQTRPQVLGGGHCGFDSTGSLVLAGRLYQLRGVKLVEWGVRNERSVSKPSGARQIDPTAKL